MSPTHSTGILLVRNQLWITFTLRETFANMMSTDLVSRCLKFQQKETDVADNDSARANTSIDWTIKESVRAKLKVIVKRTLRQYGYPPDMQKLATDTVLKQAELIAEELTSK